MTRRLLAGALVAALVGGACGGDDDAAIDATPAPSEEVAAPTPTPTVAAPLETLGPATPAASTLTLQPSVNQLHVLAAEPGQALELFDADGALLSEVNADEAGSYLWRDLDPGEYTVAVPGEPPARSEFVSVASIEDLPGQDFYDAQEIGEGFGYLTTRDGTTLSVNVALPGGEGPYPTVVEYSGYTPSNPDGNTFAQLFTALGFAYVGVNIRGTGCSGGSFQFFEPIQSLDGYDMIEAVAAQPWVLDHRVGMVGVSYPGISQLFVAQTQPPSLAAITPLSVLDDSYRSTLYPGGILNTGFAVNWATERFDEAKPSGQQWAADRIAAGDATCEANQALRLQNPDLLALIEENTFYDPAIGDEIAPVTFVDQIEVPVFLAGAWQDEQTGGHFPAMLDRFTSAPKLYATMVNGSHTESISLGILGRYIDFLDLYVAERVPANRAALVAPILAASITGVSGLTLPLDDRYSGLTYEEALAIFEADDPIRILFEEGAAEGQPAGSPLPRFEASFDAWPVPEAEPRVWYLEAGSMSEEVPTASSPAVSYTADPSKLPATTYEGDGNAIWQAEVPYDWRDLGPEDPYGFEFLSGPLAEDMVAVGSGSVDLWIRSSTGDTDLEVTLSEVRPDGTEVYIQSGWLRASRRALDEAASTETRPVHTHLEAEAAPLPDFPTEVRVELFPFAHPFRAGSRLRLTVDAPGGARPLWAFDTIAAGETVTIALGQEFPSRVVLAIVDPVAAGIDIPADPPPCGSLRSQPCRG